MVMRDWDNALGVVDPRATLPVDQILDEAPVDLDGLTVNDLMDLARDGNTEALTKLHSMQARGAA